VQINDLKPLLGEALKDLLSPYKYWGAPRGESLL